MTLENKKNHDKSLDHNHHYDNYYSDHHYYDTSRNSDKGTLETNQSPDNICIYDHYSSDTQRNSEKGVSGGTQDLITCKHQRHHGKTETSQTNKTSKKRKCKKKQGQHGKNHKVNSNSKNSGKGILEDTHILTQPQQDSEKGIQGGDKHTTPSIKEVPIPRKKLFHDPEEELRIEVIPVETDLEFLLVNSCTVDAIKIQTIVEDFIRGKEHTTIFCLTETKVDSHDFQPRGIKIFSRHRRKRNEKKGEV